MGMIVADLMAVTDAFSMITDLPRMYFIAAVGFSVWYILIFHDYRKITQAIVLLALPLFIYVAAALLARADWGQVITHSIFPRIASGPSYPTAVIAILPPSGDQAGAYSKSTLLVMSVWLLPFAFMTTMSNDPLR